MFMFSTLVLECAQALRLGLAGTAAIGPARHLAVGLHHIEASVDCCHFAAVQHVNDIL
jgi:hypothetical protein